MLRKILLGCGIVSSVWYIAADIIGGLRYSGYSWLDQEFSELTAQGAPTRPLIVALTEFPYNLLVLAFAAALSTSAGPKRCAARIAAGLVGYTGFSFVAGMITPMVTREAMAAGQDTLRNAFHGPLTLVSDLFLAMGMAFAGQLLGKGFRYYTYTSIVVLLVFGIWTSLQIPQMEANQPTPWMGLKERTNIYATMLWVAVLAIGLLRTQDGSGGGHGFGSVRADRGRQCAGRSRWAPTVPATCTGRSSRALRATPSRTGAGESAVVAVVGVARKSMRSRGC